MSNGEVTMKEPLFVIHFRYIPPEMMMAPGYCIPNEVWGIRAKGAEEAKQKFLAGLPDDPDYYEILEVEEKHE